MPQARWYGQFNCRFKTNTMTKQKEIGYEIGNVAWHNLKGYE